MKLERSRIEELLGKVFDELQTVEEKEKYGEIKREFIFHMTDWLDDLQDLVELYNQPELDASKASRRIAAFLYHVIPHVNVAGRLLLDRVPDHFAYRENESKPT